MILPLIQLEIDNVLWGLPTIGNLEYRYQPFQNLQNPDPTDDNSLTSLNISSAKAGIDITQPIQIETEVAYDDSINLVISDEKNPLKLVNSRFYQTSTMTYEVADRKGNLDTNIYSENNFKIETNLIKSVRTVSSIDFLGISDGGNMKIGNYTFYFKLADSDGNETDFIAESGKVVCHIGSINSPASIRGGQQDENSYKLIKFKLNNLDLAYDYINIYYTRSTGDGDTEIVKAYKINDKTQIINNDVEITITGFENHEEISVNELNIQYSNFDSVKSITNCQNITFAANITNDYNLFTTLEKYSLFITPEIAYDSKGIGNLNSKYNRSTSDYGYEYYNVNNIYYKLGYWDEEIYRFGIVYILNNYTLSPVFNIRGIKTLSENPSFHSFNLWDTINYSEDYIIDETKSSTNPENVKGVFKIDTSNAGQFNYFDSIKPLGIKFNFRGGILDGDGISENGLRHLTKGFFIVRQKRIPTILAQAVGIATSNKAKIPVVRGSKANTTVLNTYFTESFLTAESIEDTVPRLSPNLIGISDILSNALLCPEATLRPALFNTFFNSSEYRLRDYKYIPYSTNFVCTDSSNNFELGSLMRLPYNQEIYDAEVTLIEPGIELIANNSGAQFSSKAGDAIIPYKHLDPVCGNYEDPSNTGYVSERASKVRGEFNTFLGLNNPVVSNGKYYNIFQKNYDFTNQWQNYFKIRYNDASSFYPISDRIEWDSLYEITDPQTSTTTYYSDLMFRGDCYINTYTHRMHWNFIDPELPTNKKIIDPYTWGKNFKVKNMASTIIANDGTPGTSALTYNKLLLLFTYKDIYHPDGVDSTGTPQISPPPTINDYEAPVGLIEPDGKKFKKYSDLNGLFGAEKINRPDVNAVPLGHWVTFKICSNINLAMRDLDWTRPMEEAVHKQKRGFYPLQALDPNNHLPESNIINNGISKTLGDKYYYEIPDVPFIKTNFATRIHYSNLLQNSAFTNGNRVFESSNYQDYSREYGAVVKMVEWYGKIMVILEHGILLIPVNERAMMTNASGENVYINTDNVLPKNPKIVSNTFGSLWPESIIKTPQYIYGIDTVAKKIWRTNGEEFENISDLKIQKFLNDNIKLKESDKDRTVGTNFIKAHYNAFKRDILFVLKYDNICWNLCWNELTQRWVTQYTWFPEFSENINNIFYTFANQSKHTLAENKLFKHGFAGTEEELGDIKPTYWYGEQHPFEFEFIVGDIPGVQKIFENLKLISNLAKPDSFYYEIVGEGFDWYGYKDLIIKLNDTTIASIDNVPLTIPTLAGKVEADVILRYKEYLLAKTSIKKLPYIYVQSFDVNDPNSFFRDRGTLSNLFNLSDLRDVTLRENNKTKEKLIDVYQKGADIKKYGRMKGNMQYLEDAWNIQIQPIYLSYAYIANNDIAFTNKTEMKLRDKYIKIRVKYSGTQYAVINGIRTIHEISFA